MSVSFRDIIAAGGPTLAVLAILSVYTLALIWERWTYFRKSHKALDGFLDRLRASMNKGDLSESVALCKAHRGPASEIVMASLVGSPQKDERKRATERTLEKQLARFQQGLGTLGTIGSTAPFIGLFGTVVGVMRAFRDLAGASGAGPGVVAIGISEALVATAAGLFVAIPAIVSYNYFSTRALAFADQMRWITEEILEHLTDKAHR